MRETLSVKVTPEDSFRIREAAARAKLSVSQFIEAAVLAALGRQAPPAPGVGKERSSSDEHDVGFMG